MKKRKVFVDSDVALSSLISNKGAAYFLLNESYLDLYNSNLKTTCVSAGGCRLPEHEVRGQTTASRL